MPQNWGLGGHFRFQPFSGIWQKKNLQLGLGMLVYLLASGASFSLPYFCRHFNEDNLDEG